ncbi:MAG: DUF3040 domain-containing protein [Propionibacteriaceae bacterium]|nr:DUF3040 domain-containing protein [Propionibacteriaceae bacterium]
MALSQEEQRLLDQLEASLAADDPDLAQKFGAKPVRRMRGGRLVACVAGFIVGLAALVGGITLGWVLSVLGFVVMLASAALMLMPAASVRPQADRPAQPHAEAAASGFMDRLGERWSQRREQGW